MRNGKLKLFQTAVENLIQNSAGTTAESAPLDVYCEKPKITFNDPEKKFAPRMCLLAWCGFHGRLEFAQLLIDKGASMSLLLLHVLIRRKLNILQLYMHGVRLYSIHYYSSFPASPFQVLILALLWWAHHCYR